MTDPAECIAALKASGLVVGRDWWGALSSVERGDARVWIDTRNLVRIIGDSERDVDGKLFLDVLGIINGPEACALWEARRDV